MAKNLTPSDFGELAGDEEFISRITDFQSNLTSVAKVIDDIEANDAYSNLSPEDKVRYDLFLAFSINSLYWLYLRTQGEDPNQGDLKTEINRVKEYMAKSRKLYERKTIMPRLDKASAGRFIRSGLWDPEKKPKKTTDEETAVPNLKRKRDASESD